MLVLSRKVGEKIVFPDLGIAVQVIQVRPGRGRLGIEAPQRHRVVRAELLAQDADEADEAGGRRPARADGA